MDAHLTWPLPNVWIGVTCEDQQRADERIPLLLQLPAAVRWVSVEPMLGPVDLHSYMPLLGERCRDGGRCHHECTTECWRQVNAAPLSNPEPLLSWVVAGAESGSGHRRMDVAWMRDLRDQCQAARVPFFYKQAWQDGKFVHLPELDGRQWTEYPEA